MLSLSGIQTYLIASTITVCLAFAIYFVEINLAAKLFLVTIAVYICMPLILLTRFVRGKGRLGNRDEMSISRQIWVTLLILLATYFVLLYLAARREEAPLQTEEITRVQRRVRTRPLYKTAFLLSAQKLGGPIEDRLHAF